MSTTQQQQPVSKFLVVVGAIDASSDIWHFGNFLGFCRALRILGVENGDFWSCFPLQEYFEDGHHDSVKFGRRGKDGQNSLVGQENMEVFTQAEFNDEEKRFWEQISGDRVDELADDVLRYTEFQGKKLVAGDIFNIILIGHGTEEGTSIGDKILQAKDLAKVLDTFRPGVRVNVVVQSCDSDIFMDKISVKKERKRFIHTFIMCDDWSWAALISPSGRFPHSVFSGGFLRNLGLVGSAERTDWTLEEHINFLELNTSDIRLIARFLDVLFTDFIDRSFSQTPTATNLARRIITPSPSTTLTRPGLPQPNIPWQHMQNAVECINAELELAGDSGGEKDAALIQAATSSNYRFENHEMSKERYHQRQAEILSALRWRFRIQEYFYLVMEGLANKDLVDPDLAFKYPMYRAVKEDLRVPVIVNILKSFEIVQECCHPDPGHMEGRFFSAVYWLATLIVRSSTDLRGTLSFLMTTGLLGKVNMEYLNSIEPEEVEDVDSGKPLHPPMMEAELLPQIGF